MRIAHVLFLLGSVGAALSCAAPGVQYHGRTEPSISRPADLAEVESVPEDAERIGHVSARCRLREGAPLSKHARLVDVDCTETRLMAGIRERAAEAGGNLLVGRDCHSRVVSDDELEISCDADVARPTDDALGRRPLVSSVLAEDDTPRAAEAWHIKVHFTPSAGAPSRTARREQDVREVGYMPVSHVALGDLVTRCKEGCTERGTRLGLMAAAGRFGASDVVGVRCVAKDDGWMCTATAAVYEVDPELDPRAR